MKLTSKEIYDDYSEKYWTVKEVQFMLQEYLQWCKDVYLTPEVSKLEDVNESNIGHIVYHAEIL